MESSTFAKLPAEVRNQIWTLTVTKENGEVDMTKSKEPAITRTCRQVREETKDMYCHFNNFTINIKAPPSDEGHILSNSTAAQIASSLHQIYPSRVKQMLPITVYCDPILIDKDMGGFRIFWLTSNTFQWELIVDALAAMGLKGGDVKWVVRKPKQTPKMTGIGMFKKKAEDRVQEIQMEVDWLWACAGK